MRAVRYYEELEYSFLVTQLNEDSTIIESIEDSSSVFTGLDRLINKVFNKMELAECHLNVLEDYQEDFPDSILSFIREFKAYVGDEDYHSTRKVLNTLRIEFKALARDLSSGSYEITGDL